MRLRAMRDMGIMDVKVLTVNPKSEKEKIELSLIDNDRAGYYEDQQLAELIYPFKDELDLAGLKVDLRVPDMDLGNVLLRFSGDDMPSDEEWQKHFNGASPENIKPTHQITFILNDMYLGRLQEILAKYDKNKNIAITKLIDVVWHK